MCLQRVSEEFDPPIRKKMKAYKVFYRLPRGKVLRFPFYTTTGNSSRWFDGSRGSAVPLGKWLKAAEKEVWTNTIFDRAVRTYVTGFHVYRTRSDAKSALSWFDEEVAVVAPVYVRNVTYRGVQNRLEVLVAQEMFVPQRGL